jgi:hypothetical protein
MAIAIIRSGRQKTTLRHCSILSPSSTNEHECKAHYFFENCLLLYQTIRRNILQHFSQTITAVAILNLREPTVTTKVLTPGQPLSNPWPLHENRLVVAVCLFT